MNWMHKEWWIDTYEYQFVILRGFKTILETKSFSDIVKYFKTHKLKLVSTDDNKKIFNYNIAFLKAKGKNINFDKMKWKYLTWIEVNPIF